MDWKKVDVATKATRNDSKITSEVFSKGANKGTAPKPSDIQNMIKNINKKEGE